MRSGTELSLFLRVFLHTLSQAIVINYLLTFNIQKIMVELQRYKTLLELKFINQVC